MGGRKSGGRRPHRALKLGKLIKAEPSAPEAVLLRPKNKHISHDLGRRIDQEELEPWGRLLGHLGDLALQARLEGEVVMAYSPADLYVSLTAHDQLQAVSKKSDPAGSKATLTHLFSRLGTSRKLHPLPVKLTRLFFKHGERPHRDHRYLVAVVEANGLEANCRDIARKMGELPTVQTYTGEFRRNGKIPIARFSQPPPPSFVESVHRLKIPDFPERDSMIHLGPLEVIDVSLIKDRVLSQ